MKRSDIQRDADPMAKTAAAVDIGSNSVRLAVAQVLADGSLEVLERLQRAVRLGQDTFRRGRLGGRAMRAAVAILRDYRRILELYDVQVLRAVATSAVREASNADVFLDRIFMASGIDAEIIDTSEESRLTVSAVREELGDALRLSRQSTVVADVGGGSTLLTFLDKGEIAVAQSLRLGSIRLQEMLATSYEPPDRSADLLRQQIAKIVSVSRRSLPLRKAKGFVAVGGDARFAAKQAGRASGADHVQTVSRAALDDLVQRCAGQTPEALTKRFGLSFAEAETLNPALLVYQALLETTAAEQMVVSSVSMRDGLLLDLARQVNGIEDEAITKGVLHSATALAEKYRVDMNHARNVSRIGARLFDEFQDEHGLSARHRLLLRVAGLVHEVGSYVSDRAHHKHSYYLISNAEIFGLNRNEIMIVAHVSRYHRRACPRSSHVEYLTLSRETRMVVSKLAALLRVADALDRGHAEHAREFRCERGDEELVIYLAGVADLTLERRAVAAKGDLFEDVYGMRVRLEEMPLPAGERRRAEAVE